MLQTQPSTGEGDEPKRSHTAPVAGLLLEAEELTYDYESVFRILSQRAVVLGVAGELQIIPFLLDGDVEDSIACGLAHCLTVHQLLAALQGVADGKGAPVRAAANSERLPQDHLIHDL